MLDGPAMSLLILLAALASAPAPAAAVPQDGVQMGRIASDQRLVAEQVRRLTRLLGQLEVRDRAEGRTERAELLATAAQRLAGVNSGTDLAAAMEAIAGDLASLRTGAAVEGQAATLQALEEILQLLLQSQTQLQEQQRAQALSERIAALEELRERQQALRKRTEEMLEQARRSASGDPQVADPKVGDPKPADPTLGDPKAGEPNKGDPKTGDPKSAPSPAKPESAGAQEVGENAESPEERALREELAALAREQAELAAQIAALRDSGRQEAAERASEHAAQAAERLERAGSETPQEEEAAAGEQSSAPKPEEQAPSGAESKPSAGPPTPPTPSGPPKPGQASGGSPPPPSDPEDSERQQERAIEEQRNAEEALEDAIEQAQAELERMEQRQQLQDLEDVRMLAEQILARHRLEEAAIQELLAVGAENLTRAQRARLRQIARSEEELGAATQGLLIKIETLGASTFPFFLSSIQKDHERLAREVGPPRLQLETHAATLAADITGNWELLIDVIRTEAERLSNEMEQQKPPSEGKPAEPAQEPLVNFAQELQLLKRLEEGLSRDLVWLRRKFDTFAAAGIEAGPDDEHALGVLLDRQLELRRQFEDMLARLQAQQAERLPSRDL